MAPITRPLVAVTAKPLILGGKAVAKGWGRALIPRMGPGVAARVAPKAHELLYMTRARATVPQVTGRLLYEEDMSKILARAHVKIRQVPIGKPIRINPLAIRTGKGWGLTLKTPEGVRMAGRTVTRVPPTLGQRIVAPYTRLTRFMPSAQRGRVLAIARPLETVVIRGGTGQQWKIAGLLRGRGIMGGRLIEPKTTTVVATRAKEMLGIQYPTPTISFAPSGWPYEMLASKGKIGRRLLGLGGWRAEQEIFWGGMQPARMGGLVAPTVEQISKFAPIKGPTFTPISELPSFIPRFAPAVGVGAMSLVGPRVTARAATRPMMYPSKLITPKPSAKILPIFSVREMTLPLPSQAQAIMPAVAAKQKQITVTGLFPPTRAYGRPALPGVPFIPFKEDFRKPKGKPRKILPGMSRYFEYKRPVKWLLFQKQPRGKKAKGSSSLLPQNVMKGLTFGRKKKRRRRR